MSSHVKADIHAYVNGSLPPSRARDIDQHLAECESCRHALNKTRAKVARANRQALKKAASEPLPNLLLSRLRKEAGLDRKPRRTSAVWLGILLVGGGVVFLARHYKSGRHLNAPQVSLKEVTPKPEPPPVLSSSSTPEAVAVSSPVSITPPAPEPPKRRDWSGPESAIKDYREIIVRNWATWEALWTEMNPQNEVPAVHFNYVVAAGIFTGAKPSAGYKVILGEPREQGDDILIPFRILEPPPGQASATVITHPYALMTLPRTMKKIRFVQEASQ